MHRENKSILILQPLKPAFKGKFPLKCGPKDYFYTSLSADQYLQVVFADMWKKAGGTWKGKVVQGKLPEDSDDYKVLASSYSEPLTKLVYNMNKYSDKHHRARRSSSL